MKLNIPSQTIQLTCPSCQSTTLSVDENQIVTCGICGLKINKNELIEQNNLSEKIDVEKLKKNVTNEMKKIFKGKHWK